MRTLECAHEHFLDFDPQHRTFFVAWVERFFVVCGRGGALLTGTASYHAYLRILESHEDVLLVLLGRLERPGLCPSHPVCVLHASSDRAKTAVVGLAAALQSASSPPDAKGRPAR